MKGGKERSELTDMTNPSSSRPTGSGNQPDNGGETFTQNP